MHASCRRARRRARCARCSTSASADTRRSGPRSRPASTAERFLREGRRGSRRQRKRASPGWRGAARPRRRRSRKLERMRRARSGRHRWCFWGAGAESPGWLVRCLDEFAQREIKPEGRTKIESAPTPRASGALHVLRRSERSRRRRCGRPRRSPGCVRSASTWACSAHIARPSRRWRRRRAAAEPAAAGRGPPLDSRVDDGDHCPTRAGGGPCRPPSTSGADLRHRRRRRWAVGCLFSTRRTSRSTCARFGAAVVLLLKEKAELLERGLWELHSETATLARPVVIRLVTYVNVPRDAHRRKITTPRRVSRATSWTLPVLRLALQFDGRSRDPALQGRLFELGEHRRVVRTVQPAQGRPTAAPGRHAPAPCAAHAARGDLHPRRQPDDPGCVGWRICRRQPRKDEGRLDGRPSRLLL